MGSIVHQVAVNKLYGWSFLAVSTHQTYNFMQMVKFRCWFLSNTLNQGGHIIFKGSLFSEDIMMFSIMYRCSPTYIIFNNADLTYVPFCHLSSWVDCYTNANFAQRISKVIIEKSRCGRFLWNRNWDLGITEKKIGSIMSIFWGRFFHVFMDKKKLKLKTL